MKSSLLLLFALVVLLLATIPRSLSANHFAAPLMHAPQHPGCTQIYQSPVLSD